MKAAFKISTVVFILLQCAVYNDSAAQVRFRSGMFFHHSTGENIWGPNGSNTSVPQEMTRYNTQHGYYGQNAVTMTETWFPVNWDNEWATWHTIFEINYPENISSYYNANKIIMVKSCFPSSALEGIGQPADTQTPDYKTIYNYKWHWRHIITVMKSRPQNFFVIWTNAPLTQSQTNQNAAMWSRQFCKWAKDTLAQGLDPVFGIFPNNVYVFDFFSKLTNAQGYMLPQYAVAPDDPHPNAAATALVAPLLVDEVFDHSIAYEQVYGIKKLNEIIPDYFCLYQNYPNPFNPVTKIRFSLPNLSPHNGGTSSVGAHEVKLVIHDIIGREVAVLVNETLGSGVYEIVWNSAGFPSGIYFYKLLSGDFEEVKKMTLIK